MKCLNVGNIVGLLQILPGGRYSHRPHVLDCTRSRMQGVMEECAPKMKILITAWPPLATDYQNLSVSMRIYHKRLHLGIC